MRDLKYGLVFLSSVYSALLGLVLLITSTVSADTPRRSPFTWKTGVWGVCVAEQCGLPGLQVRSVWCIHSEGWSTHRSNCPPSQRPVQQRQCVKVCEWQRQLFEWQASPWGPCAPAPELQVSRCVTAQRGLQRRSVACVHRGNGSAASARVCEAFSPPPEAEQACLLPCPLDCVVSALSHWSPCSRTCGPALQQRMRHVLAPPLYGGVECPELTDTRPCNHDNKHPARCPSDQQEHSYSLWAGPWSSCRRKGTPPSGRTTVDFSSSPSGNGAFKVLRMGRQHHRHDNDPLQHQHHEHQRGSRGSWEVHVGYQTRQLRCTRSDGKNAMLSLCDSENVPVNFRSCAMPRDCEVSDWSAWSACSKSCSSVDQVPGFRSRTRGVRGVPAGGGEECPGLEEVQTCNTAGELLPLCPRYEWKVTNWGSCQVRPLLSQQDHRHANSSFLCGGGIQTREAYCVSISDNTTASPMWRPVGRGLCSAPPPVLIQSCSVPCSRHCRLSPWSTWGPCIHDNSPEQPGRKGVMLRMRSVSEEAWGQSESCPHITEAMTCHPLISFQWQVTGRGPCEPQDGVCGSGTQQQSVECVTVSGETVSGTRCGGERPRDRGECETPCSADCVLSDWSSWTSCSPSCSQTQTEGKQRRTRTILAPPAPGGKSCRSGSDLEQWRSCGSQSCTVFLWDSSSWSSCSPDLTVLRSEEGGCGSGTQTRRVYCRTVEGEQVEPHRCPESSRPDQVRACTVPCPVDCTVTPFSNWSPCPTSCSTVNVTLSTQSRQRIVIQRPANGGQDCPATLFEQRDCNPPPLCPQYRWQTHRWQSCVLVPDSVRQAVGGQTEACGLGLETRGVVCVGLDDVPADEVECVRWAGVRPVDVQQCRVSCRDDCTLSSWSKFSPCTHCGAWSTRTRSLIGRSKKRWRCQQEALVEREACPCSEYRLQPHGPWSPCLLPAQNHHHHPPGFTLTHTTSHPGQGAGQGWWAQGEGRECGDGWRYRALACLNHRGELSEPSYCNSSGIEEEVCMVPCPLDCRLSDWSAWSSCSASCGGGVKVRSQWLREKPFNGGRPCPKLDFKNQAQVSEVVPCYSECNQYVWETDPWSVCVVNPPNALNSSAALRPLCGEGVQIRTIRCVWEEEEKSSVVDNSQCEEEERPVSIRSCVLPCPGNCVTSDWSLWSPCPAGCNERDMRWRSRTVLRKPGNGHTCPELNQTQSCSNTTCLSYSYAYSDWSSCELSKNAVCGRGTKTRLLNCVCSDGKLVKLSMCKEWGPSRGKLLAPCEVSCPVDCLLSDWSHWSECSHSCGAQSHMVRSRLVLQQDGEGGRPCPSQLSQTRPCPIRPCFSWRWGGWSSCRVEGAECGEGVRERNLSCVVHWGSLSGSPLPRVVPEERCVETRLTKTTGTELQQTCSIPCPGDCYLAEWSAWSACQLLCLDGRSFETSGQQARSRAVVMQVPQSEDSCPRQVYESRPCTGGSCLSYEWVTGGWRDNQRAVWCQRSDGVNVTGGCFPQNKPAAVRHCHPPCTKPFSYCTQSGVCGCGRGFTEVMTSLGFLDYCMGSAAPDYKKADVKTSAGRPRTSPVQKHDRPRDWALQPLGPDGRVRLWVYGLMAAGFIMILLIITMSFLLCKNPKDHPNPSSTQKALALAYDGDADM